MIILTYFKDKKIVAQKFMENKDYTNKELYDVINNLCNGAENMPKIYLNGMDLVKYSDMGIVIDHIKLINRFETVLDSLKLF